MVSDNTDVDDVTDSFDNMFVYSIQSHDVTKYKEATDYFSVTLPTPYQEGSAIGCVRFKLDSQAECSVLSLESYERMKHNVPALKPSTTKIMSFGNSTVTPLGYTHVDVLVKGVKHTVRCEVVPNVPNLLSSHDSLVLGLITKAEVHKLNISDSSSHECKYESTAEIINDYADVFTGLGRIPGTVSLKVDPNFTPVAHPPRPIPVALREKVRDKLEEMVQDGIIERVPVGTPTPWCSPMHVVLKPDKSVRITIDPKDLNKALIREYHPINTVEEVAQRCPGARFFTVLDANQGYYQIVLDDESRNYTAFNTPFGRYRFLRLPMGISSAPEIFARVFGDIFADVGVELIMDDLLVAEETLEDHDKVLRETLQKARDNRVTFSAKKLQPCMDKVKYSGQQFSEKGLQIDPDRIKAITEMPDPQSIKQVQTLLGMVTYICKYMKNLSSVTEPLRTLLKEANEPGFKFHFDEIHREACTEIRRMLSTAPVLRYFDVKKPVTISCDASQSGLGYVLMQDGQPVAFSSKALTNTEYAYAQIEKELLAIVCAVKKFHTYIYGKMDVTIETDHAPLQQILEKPLHQVPLRLQKMRMKLQGYDFQLVVKRGKDIPVADALSRVHLPETDPVVEVFTVSTEEIPNVKQVSPTRLEEIKKKTAEDRELQALIELLASPSGWPAHKAELDPVLHPYFDVRDEINTVDGIVFKGQRIIIPKDMRAEALDILHASHQGIVKTKQLARDLMYWPGLNGAIEDKVSRCSACQEHRSMQAKEPLLPTPVPSGPWEHVAEDLFDFDGNKWLVMVDYYSEYFEIEKMDHTTGQDIILQNKRWFATHGIPMKVTSDNGPPWNGYEWKKFASDYGFVHQPISPTHSQSNGMVEKTVDIAKRLLKKCQATGEDLYLALLQIRNTPRDEVTGSPVQRLFSRRTRTRLPTAPQKLKPQVIPPEQVAARLYEDRHVKAKSYFDQHTRPLKPIEPDTTIRVRTGNKWAPALLLPSDEHLGPRSYNVKLPSGHTTRRNRRHILPTKEQNIYRPPVRMDDEDNLPEKRCSTREQESSDRRQPPIASAKSSVPKTPVPKSPVASAKPLLPKSPVASAKPLLPKSPVASAKSPVASAKPPVPMRDKSVFTRSGRLSKPPAKFLNFVP